MVRKNISQASENLRNAATYIPARYRSGIEAATWQKEASSEGSEERFAQALREAINAKRRMKALQGLSDSDWRDPAMEHGASIIASRIQDAIPKWEEKFGPILDAMNNAAERAPAKSLDAMQNIDNRLKPVVKAAQEASER